MNELGFELFMYLLGVVTGLKLGWWFYGRKRTGVGKDGGR